MKDAIVYKVDKDGITGHIRMKALSYEERMTKYDEFNLISEDGEIKQGSMTGKKMIDAKKLVEERCIDVEVISGDVKIDSIEDLGKYDVGITFIGEAFGLLLGGQKLGKS